MYRHPAVGHRPFTLDAFAGDTNTKVSHSFYSKVRKAWMPRASLGSHWADEAVLLDQWAFSEMGRILKKSREEKCDAELLHPVSSSYCTGMLCSLPVKARLPVTTAQITAGYRLPDSKKTLNFSKLAVSIILW